MSALAAQLLTSAEPPELLLPKDYTQRSLFRLEAEMFVQSDLELYELM